MENFVHPEKLAPRLCHLTKWPDFDGFGFNLQLGQYIGKVDDDSPAQLADLREGDRIIEVNGVNISNENHKQVVERIKAIQNETRLLVVDKETYEWYNERNIVLKSTQPNVIYCSTPVPRPELVTKSISLNEHAIEKKDNSENEVFKKSEENLDEVTSKLKSTKIQNNSSLERNNNNEKAANQNLVLKTPQKTHNFIVVDSEEQFENEKRLQEKKEQKKLNSLSPHQSISNSSQNIDFNLSNSLKNGLSSSNSSFSDNLDLNLNMSASEMRKLIASRKNLKTDVKKAQLDLRQKYQIIQQM